MYDQPLFLKTLSRFAAVLSVPYDLDTVLTELTKDAASVLTLCGAGLTMANDGRLRYVTTVTLAAAELERHHALLHPCPCRDAYTTGEVVRVTDMREESTRWPEFAAAATRLGVAGVAAVPMRLDNQIIGAFNLYSTEPRQWSDGDIAVAGVLADLAISYLVNVSKLSQQEQPSRQLQEVLDTRVIIEQAKRITALQHSSTVDQAYERMRTHARNENASIGVVAEAIVRVGLGV